MLSNRPSTWVAVLFGAYICQALSPLRPQRRSLEECGDASYDPQMYTCYNGNFLCPVKNGQPTKLCGEACYLESEDTCYDGNFLCPVLSEGPTLRCGQACYLPSQYGCSNGQLTSSTNPSQPSAPSASSVASTTPSSSSPSASATSSACAEIVSNLVLTSPPYSNYFASDCHTSGQVIVTSPLSDSNLTIIGPRVIFAWPGGNSGVAAFFAPSNGVNGTLAIRLVNSTVGSPLGTIYEPSGGDNSSKPVSGLSTQIHFNASAKLDLAILGSIRTIRDFVEGPSLLQTQIQSAIKYEKINSGVGGIRLSRLWLDNITTTTLTLVPISDSQKVGIDNTTVSLDAGSYMMNASFNYPQIAQLSSQEVLSPRSAELISQQPQHVESLTFLSYKKKLLAGAWRFLTYFGRDSMISALLLQPILSQGKGGAIEAVIGAVLERINSTDGSICHEETIGDYATWTNLENNITSTAPLCSYIMIDSDYYLPVLMNRYFVEDSVGQGRVSEFFKTHVSFMPSESNLTYADMALRAAERLMTLAGPFAAPNNQTMENLMHLKQGEVVGQWRDSTYGIGGGRIPMDVNTGLAPAALRAIGSLARAGFYPTHPDWKQTADSYADVWENSTLSFFEVTIPQDNAKSLLSHYVNSSSFHGKSQANLIDANVTFPAISLDGNNGLAKVEVMHSDTAFRLALVNDTNNEQLTAFLNNTATSVRRRFPAGLMTDVGMLVANPAYGQNPIYAANWTTSAYHGTVVWSFQLALMASGFETQLSRCNSSESPAPTFCNNRAVYCNALSAYNELWDVIEANQQHLSTEVWSWTYNSANNKFDYIDLGNLPPPPGQSPTEADIVQLWSLTFLAVTRNTNSLSLDGATC